MRILPMVVVLGTAITALAPGLAQAAPTGFHWAPDQSAGRPVVAVQLRCDPSRCIDPSTGAYTQSGCNWQGCYPISGVVGYTDPSSAGYGSSYAPRRYHHPRWDGRYGY